jgi:hypothetical protein
MSKPQITLDQLCTYIIGACSQQTNEFGSILLGQEKAKTIKLNTEFKTRLEFFKKGADALQDYYRRSISSNAKKQATAQKLGLLERAEYITESLNIYEDEAAKTGQVFRMIALASPEHRKDMMELLQFLADSLEDEDREKATKRMANLVRTIKKEIEGKKQVNQKAA